MTNHKYYDKLEIKTDASKKDIAEAYRRLALKNHPLRNEKSKVAEFQLNFSKVSEAYEILSNPGHRALYDAHGDTALHNGILTGPD
jgi:DnaJ-class molecular chaperone